MRLTVYLFIAVLIGLWAECSLAKKHDEDEESSVVSPGRKDMIHYFNEDIEALPELKDRDSRPDFDNDSGNKRPTKRPTKRPNKRPNKKKPNKKKKKPKRRPRPSRRKQH